MLYFMRLSFNQSGNGSGRSDVRSISKENGIVMVGQNLAMMKIGFEEWKGIFHKEIENVKKERENIGSGMLLEQTFHQEI